MEQEKNWLELISEPQLILLKKWAKCLKQQLSWALAWENL